MTVGLYIAFGALSGQVYKVCESALPRRKEWTTQQQLIVDWSIVGLDSL